jgi:hypothetical protein
MLSSKKYRQLRRNHPYALVPKADLQSRDVPVLSPMSFFPTILKRNTKHLCAKHPHSITINNLQQRADVLFSESVLLLERIKRAREQVAAEQAAE